MRSSLSSEGFFRSGVTMEDVSGDGKVHPRPGHSIR